MPALAGTIQVNHPRHTVTDQIDALYVREALTALDRQQLRHLLTEARPELEGPFADGLICQLDSGAVVRITD